MMIKQKKKVTNKDERRKCIVIKVRKGKGIIIYEYVRVI